MAASATFGTDFGTVPTNTSASVTLSITNFGSAALQISGVSTSGAAAGYFTVSNLPSIIAVGSASNFLINYAPTNTGSHIASFSIANNGTNTPYVINVAGSGIRPGEMRLQGTFLDYTATYGGANPAVKTFALQNVGDAAYNYTNTISYGAGGSGWLTVTFRAPALWLAMMRYSFPSAWRIQLAISASVVSLSKSAFARSTKACASATVAGFGSAAFWAKESVETAVMERTVATSRVRMAGV